MEKQAEMKQMTLQEQLAAARAEGIRQGKLDATKRALQMLQKTTHCTLDDALLMLEVPRKERKTYVKIFAAVARQKQKRQ